MRGAVRGGGGVRTLAGMDAGARVDDGAARLFVYGLLRRGMSARLGGLVPGKGRFLAEATARGFLFSVGGAYPALVTEIDDGTAARFGLDPAAGSPRARVTGELWAITNELAWPVLDDFEGIGPDYPPPQLYRREPILARTDDGREVPAQAYVYNRDVADLPPVPSGDWANR